MRIVGVPRKHQRNGVVLLTAAVSPNVGFAVTVVDPSERLRQYQSAIQRWAVFAQRSDKELVIVETSGADEDELLACAPTTFRDRCAVIPFTPSESSLMRGKGAAEADALDAATAVLAARAPATTDLVKVTGRLFVLNASQVLTPRVEQPCIQIRRSLDRSYCDTRLIRAPLGVWSESLQGLSNEVDDQAGIFLEHVLAKRLVDLEFSGRVVVDQFSTRPMFQGQSGSNGNHYGGRKSRVREQVAARLEPVLKRLSSKQV